MKGTRILKQKILVVEDEKHISKLVKYNLEKAGFECETVPSGEEALTFLDRTPVSLIVLDVMLPAMDGFEVCRTLKKNSGLREIPVVMLTAKGEEVDRVVGLELGADDYIVKPFSLRELVLRVKAILRRPQKGDEKPKEQLEAGTLAVDIPRHRVTVNRKEVELTAMEFKLLVTLMERRGLVQTREKLLSDIWDIHADIESRTVDTHVKRIREKLGKAGLLIETVVGMGYRFKEDTDEN